MSEQKEPQEAREFWIYRNEEYAPTYACDFNQRGFVPSKNRESIHVIEYSEYEKLQKENDKLKNYDIASLEVMLEELKKENAILRELVNKARSLIEIDNVFGVGVEWTNFRHWANEVDQALEKVKSERAEAE